MTTIARRVASVPVRSSVETWQAVRDLLAPPASEARRQFDAVTSVAAVIIAEEYTAEAPIVVIGSGGPRVRVYTVNGEDAVDAHGDEVAFPIWPCDEDWVVSLPCGGDDLAEMAAALADQPRFSVRDMQDGIHVDGAEKSSSAVTGALRPTIDLAELERQ